MNSYIHILVLTVLCGISMSCADDSLPSTLTCTATCPSVPISCEEIKEKIPQSPSGVYLIATTEKRTQYVYCHTETLCDSEGGWTRLAHIDMTDPSSENWD